MSTLAEHLDDYLRMRRALGFQLGRHGQVLPQFVAYLEASGVTTVTVELAVAWARLPERIKPITIDFRLSAVRGFAHYLHAIDPAHEILPPGLLAVPQRRPAPYLYASGEIAEVLRTTRRLRPPLRAATYRTLFGLLAATGMRLGEALVLSRADVDLVDGLVTIRHAKFDRMRLVPLHPSVTAALRGYASTRKRLCPAPRTDRFFVSATGRALRREEADHVFRVITGLIRLRTGTVRPRIHDLRHSFAVRTLIDGHRDGRDVSALLPVLSTYLGHVEPSKGSQIVFARHGARGLVLVCALGLGGVTSVSVVWAPVALARGCIGIFIERNPQVDLDSPAGDADVIDDEAQQLLALLEVEFVDAEGCPASEVADSLLEAVVDGELLTLGDELVALFGEGVVTEVNVSCSPLHLVELEQAGLVQVDESSSFGPVVFDLASESIEFGAEQRVIG